MPDILWAIPFVLLTVGILWALNKVKNDKNYNSDNSDPLDESLHDSSESDD